MRGKNRNFILQLYLQRRLKSKSTLAKPILQFSLIAVAWFVALSRVMNNKHHWSDVLAGMLLGSTVAIINVSEVMKCNQPSTREFHVCTC